MQGLPSTTEILRTDLAKLRATTLPEELAQMRREPCLLHE